MPSAQGKERDWETGLDYVEARYYDPSLGMFRQVDPLWEKIDQLNPYNYCYNDPINYIDPDGLETISGAQNNWANEFNGNWNAIWHPKNGSMPGLNTWQGSVEDYLENYQNELGGHWEKQYYGTGVTIYNEEYFEWQGFDWVWVGPYPVNWIDGMTGKLFGDVNDVTHYFYKNGRWWGEDDRSLYLGPRVITGEPPLISRFNITNILKSIRFIEKGIIIGDKLRMQLHKHKLPILKEGIHIELRHLNINKLHIFDPFQKYWKITGSKLKFWWRPGKI